MATATSSSRAGTEAARFRPGAGVSAAVYAIEHNTVPVQIPVLGTVKLPPMDHLAFYAGLAAVAAIGLVEWPVAAVLGLGHLLAEDHHHRLLRDFGKAMEEA